jgi:hypothetical protein
MKELQRRIKAVEMQVKNRTGGTYTVYFKNGSTRHITPADLLRLSLEEADNIDHFEEDEGGNNGGVMEGLANALLIPGE